MKKIKNSKDDVLNCKMKPPCVECPYACLGNNPKRKPLLDARGIMGSGLGKITDNDLD